jgi:hypothetical protein
MAITLKGWRGPFWVSGRVYGEDPELIDPHHADHSHSGVFGAVINCEPDDDGFVTFEFELSETAEKSVAHPFPEGGLGGQIHVRVPDPRAKATTALNITVLRLETTRAQRPDVASEGDRGSFFGVGRLGTHPTANAVLQSVEIQWLVKKKEFRVAGVRMKIEADVWAQAYEGAMYMAGFK